MLFTSIGGLCLWRLMGLEGVDAGCKRNVIR
jgi:hypothetical protein